MNGFCMGRNQDLSLLKSKNLASKHLESKRKLQIQWGCCACGHLYMIHKRRGPWTLEEDNLLINYIACRGEGRWNMLAKCSGLRRTGKSCRLRWLNYLNPDIKHGNLSLEEQVLILELHSKWGNRWSRIAQHLPGRTDNEIKNYWRTRVQKHARHLNVDANSTKFRDAVRCFWMPRLVEKIEENSRTSPVIESPSSAATFLLNQGPQTLSQATASLPPIQQSLSLHEYDSSSENYNSPSISSSVPDTSAYSTYPYVEGSTAYNPCLHGYDLDAFDTDPMSGFKAFENSISDRQLVDNYWVSGEMPDSMWNIDELLQFTELQEISP